MISSVESAQPFVCFHFSSPITKATAAPEKSPKEATSTGV